MSTLVLSTSLYCLPKAFSYLSTCPSDKVFNQEPLTHVEKLQTFVAECKGKAISYMGNKAWDDFNVIVIDNLWLTTLAISQLPPITASKTLAHPLKEVATLSLPVVTTPLAFVAKGLTRIASIYLGCKNLAEVILPLDQKEDEKRVVIESEQIDYQNLISLRFIPPALHREEPFKNYICPLTEQPIRHPVKDPHDGKLYEQDEILSYLEKRNVSPISGHYLSPAHLKVDFLAKALIENKLRHLQSRLPNRTRENQKWAQNLLENRGKNLPLPQFFTDIQENDFYICPISRKFIATIAVPVGDIEEGESPHLYDRDTLIEWIEKTPNEAPPHWPVGRLPLPLRGEYVQAHKRLQAEHESRIRSFAKWLISDTELVDLSLFHPRLEEEGFEEA